MRYGDDFGFYELNPFPGCNQLVVSNHAFIYPEQRGKGHGKAQHSERLQEMHRLGYDAAICTVQNSNKVEREILIKNGWTIVFKFKSTETGHLIDVYMRGISDDFRYPAVETE